MAWVCLALAIGAEVAGTLALRGVAGSGVRWLPVSGVVVGYAVSFVFMALALRSIGVGTVYAIWSGVGTAAVAGLGVLLFGERVGWGGALGMVLIVVGVVVLVASGGEHSSSSAAPAAASRAAPDR